MKKEVNDSALALALGDYSSLGKIVALGEFKLDIVGTLLGELL